MFRPSITRASLPLAVGAVALPAATGVLVRLDLLPWWTLATALAGSLLVFATSFLMPLLRSVRVRPGEISGPAAYGIHTLRLERLDLARSFVDEPGQALLVDRVGSQLLLSRMDLREAEIVEALEISGLDPDRLRRVAMRL